MKKLSVRSGVNTLVLALITWLLFTGLNSWAERVVMSWQKPERTRWIRWSARASD
jgi:hypothetical protein